MTDKIVIAGYIGFGNAGDEAIAKSMTEHLRAAIPGVEITVVSGDPAHTAEAYGVRAIGWRDPLSMVEAVRDAGLTIIGGGGLFHDYWGFDPDAVLTPEHWGIGFYIAPALAAAVCGKPVMLYAAGVGPLFSEYGRRYTRAAADIADRITVRDAASQQLLVELGIPAGRIVVTADPAFDLTPAEAPATAEVAVWTSNRPAIAVCLRNWTFGTNKDACEREIAGALDAVLESEGGRALFVPFHRDGSPDDDLAVSRRIAAQLQRQDAAVVLEAPRSAAELAGIIGQADLVLGMRLHSILFSAAAGVPFVAIEYDPKVSSGAGVAGLEEWTLPFSGVEAEHLAERMRAALRNRERFACAASIERGPLRAAARENAAIAAQLLREGKSPRAYDPDTYAILARMLRTQTASNANLAARLAGASEEAATRTDQLNSAWQELTWVRERAEGALRELRQAQAELSQTHRDGEALRAEVSGLSAELDMERAARAAQIQENARLERAGQEAGEAFRRLQDETAKTLVAQQQTAAELAARQSARISELEHRIGALESKRPGAIAKRTLQLALDVVQVCTPGPLRRAVRKQYLRWFYFRIYPEKRRSAEEG